ncbi:uncharacterized protein LOC122244196 [Penaeus japonicus]|uniref:uncharacterized protein LOC122244196 n=1 Tax=Penaeus japonicus TaxID=27405 RepID=UPI001C713D5B|nr:uncharacterized protein LOC122244196 [Penaeus japonicus]
MKELNNLVVKKSGDYSLSGDVTYQNNLEVTGTLTSPKLNGIDVSNIVDLQMDHITGNYTFTNVNVNTAINSNSINGIDTNVDVVTIHADETVLGRLTFTDDVSVIGPEGVELVVLATINSIHPSTLKTIDDQGNLQINTNVTFNTTLHVSANVVLDVVNNLDMRGIEDRYWRKSTDQIVTVGPSIDSVTFEAPATAQSVNGHQMNDFLNVAGSQIIDGTYSFQSLVTIDGSLDMVDGKTISGVDVSALKNNLVTLADDQSIDALTSFSGEISASGNLMLSGKLNGWDLTSDLMRLDLSLPLTGSLTFVDKTTATSLKLSNSNLVVQSLNGLNVENAKADLVLVNEDASIAGSLKFTSSVSAKSLDVSGTVDNVDMEDLVSRSLKKNSATAQSVSGAISVNKGVDFGQNPSLGVVNGKDWTTHLAKVVPVNYNGVISGRKAFSQPLSISGNFNPTTLNGFDVAQLASRILTKGTNQNVAGKYTINGDVTARNVNAPEIDGVSTDNLVLVDQTSSVSGTVTFAESLETKDITSNSGILDGCDLIQLNTSTVWRAADGSIEIAFPVTLNSLSVGGDCTVNDAVKAGTEEVLNFLDTLVLKSSDQEISGEVEFITDITMKNLVAGTADGVDIDNLYDVTVLDNEDSVIDCDVAFTTHLSVQDLDVTSAVSGLGTEGVLIDHINVTDMNVNAVLLQGGSYLMTGAKTFTGGLTTSGLGIGGSLGGIPVTELVVVSSSSRLADDLIFRAATTVKGDLQVEGLIDNVDLGQLLVDRITLDSAETLTSSTSFQGINVEGDLVVEEINGISLSDIVLKSGRNRHDITGEKNFAGGLHAKGEIQATVINRVNIHELNEKIVRKDRATTINTNMIFENTVEAKSAIDVVGAVNGYKLSDVNYPPSVLNQNIISKSNKLADLNKTLSDIFVDTKTLACGMYETILYGEILNVENVAFSGKMSFGNFGDTPFLVLRECDILCTCASHYYFYHVTSDLDLLQDFNDENSAFIFDTEGFEGTGIVNNCTGDDEVKLLQITDSSHNVGNLGAIADVSVFVVNGVPYMVTAGTVAEASPGATTKIHVIKIIHPRPVIVWSMQTPYSASSVDVTSSDDGWLLLVANQMALNDPIDPFTAPSQLYLWSSTEEKFSLVEEYIGQHVISGIFLNAQYGPKESFFSLAQLQAASSPVFEDNVKYTTQVLVFKLGETGYRPYQSLPSYGVVAQESLSIGDDLYLLLLSDFTHTLDVYENRPSEGFRLHQKIPICSKPIDVKKIVVSFKEFILVSCKEPAQIMKIRFLSKGFTYKE